MTRAIREEAAHVEREQPLWVYDDERRELQFHDPDFEPGMCRLFFLEDLRKAGWKNLDQLHAIAPRIQLVSELPRNIPPILLRH